MKLKICFVTQQYRNIQSGVGTYSTYLIDALAEKGHEITVICPSNSITSNKNITFMQVPKSKIDPTWISLARQSSKCLNDKKFDIIHFTNARDSLFYQSNLIPTVGTAHDFYSAIAPKNMIWYKKHYPCDWIKRLLYYNINKMLEKRALSKLNNIISVCIYTAEQLSEKYAIPNSKFHVIYNGIDVKKYNNFYMSYKNKRRSYNNPIILFLGGGNFQRKNLPLVIKSSSEVIKGFPTTQFHVVGKDQNENYMKKLTKKLGVDKNFSFLGHVENNALQRLYITSNVFVMPSLYESFAFTFIEAMALGTPVIGGKIGGAVELINHGENGFLVGPHDYKNLAKYILMLLQSESVWGKISKKARKTVEKFNIESMIKNTVNVYINTIKSRS